MAKGKTPRAGIEVGVNDKPAIEGLKSITRAFGETAVSINASMEIAGKVFGAVSAAIGAVTTAVVDATKAAMEQERVERRAVAALQLRGDVTRADLEALKAQNQARQQLLGINDEEQLQLQGTLAAMGVRKDALNAVTEATIGLAQVTGGELAEAGKAVAKAMAGDVGALKEYGIVARDVADAQQQLSGMFGLATAQSDSLETKIAALSAGYDDFQATLGSAVTQSGAAKDITDTLTKSLRELTDFLSGSETKRAVDGFFRFFAEQAANAIDAMEGMRKATSDVITWFKRTFTNEVIVESLAPQETMLERLANNLRKIGTSEISVEPPSEAAALTRPGGRATTRGGAARAGRGAAGTGRDMMTDMVAIYRERQEQAARIADLDRQMLEHRSQIASEAADIEFQIARDEIDRRNALFIEGHQLHLELRREMATQELEQRVEAGRMMAEAETLQMETLRDIGKQSMESFSGNLSQMIVSVAAGEQSIGQALEGFVRQIAMQIGTMLVSTGTAALALQALSFIPGLWAVTGPPGLSTGAAIAAIGIGTAMIAGASVIPGGARSSSARGGGSGGSNGAASAPRAMGVRDLVPRGFGSLMTAGAQPYAINIQFNNVVGDERRAARMIEDVLRRGR